MKKQYKQAKSFIIERQKIKERKLLRLRRKKTYWKKLRRRQYLGVCKWKQQQRKRLLTDFWEYKKIKAPENLSLIHDTEEMLHFINQLSKAYESRKKVFIRLNGVKHISGDGLIILLSNVAQFKSARIDFNGDFPKDKSVYNSLLKTSFYDAIYNKNYLKNGHYDLTKNDIFTHAQKNVDADLTAGLIEENSPFLWGEKRRSMGLQRIFIELMQNTNNHASHTLGDKLWWLNVTRKHNPKTLCFSFIDYGMGIFNSLSTKTEKDKFYGWITKVIPFFNPEDHNVLLEAMLQGRFHKTVTGKYYRGKGLPGIYNQLNKNSISNLIIISNDVYANVKNNNYIKLRNTLEGTFVYFEVDSTCNNLPV